MRRYDNQQITHNIWDIWWKTRIHLYSWDNSATTSLFWAQILLINSVTAAIIRSDVIVHWANILIFFGSVRKNTCLGSILAHNLQFSLGTSLAYSVTFNLASGQGTCNSDYNFKIQMVICSSQGYLWIIFRWTKLRQRDLINRLITSSRLATRESRVAILRNLIKGFKLSVKHDHWWDYERLSMIFWRMWTKLQISCIMYQEMYA